MNQLKMLMQQKIEKILFTSVINSLRQTEQYIWLFCLNYFAKQENIPYIKNTI